jgi:hypothetical protein
MLVSATHTHSAPSVMGCLGSRADPHMAAILPARIAEAIAGAARDLVPAQVGWAAVDDWQHTFTRRWIRRPDRMLADPFGAKNVHANMHPGHESPDVVGPSGPVDPGLSVLAVRAPDGRPLALLANYSQHYYDSPPVSSDYAGRFVRHVASLLGAEGGSPPFVGILSQGTSGDLMWMDYGSPRHEIGYDAYALEVAGRAVEAYRRVAWHDWVPLRIAETALTLHYRVPDESRMARARAMLGSFEGRPPRSIPEVYAGEAIALRERPRTELVLQAIRVGELGIAAIPNEVFALTGLKLKARSPLQPTFTIALANGEEGYIPPPEQHALGGYTTWPARTAGLEVRAEPRIVEAILGLLEEVSGRPRRDPGEEHGPYARRVLDSRPTAYWRLDDMESPTACDATRTGHDAVYEDGVALYLPGPGSGSGRLPRPELTPSNFSGSQINRAAHFAGGRLRAGVVPSRDSYSVELWIWNGLPTDARPVTGYVVSLGTDGDAAARGDHLGLGGARRAEEAGRLIVTNGREVLAGRTPIGLREWHHVVLVRRERTVSVYLDGREDLRGDLERTLPASGSALFVGGRCDRADGFEGRVDEVAVYDRTLDAGEISEHFQLSGLAAGPAGECR